MSSRLIEYLPIEKWRATIVASFVALGVQMGWFLRDGWRSHWGPIVPLWWESIYCYISSCFDWDASGTYPESFLRRKKCFFCENYSRFTYLFFTITYLPSYFSPSVFEVLKIIRQAQNQIELEKTVGYRFVSGLGTFLRRATNLCILHLPLAYSSYSLCSRYLYLPSTAVYNMTWKILGLSDEWTHLL